MITKRRAFILDGEGEREQHVFLFNVVVLKNVNLCHIYHNEVRWTNLSQLIMDIRVCDQQLLTN